MRIWSLHPKYLDARGLVALWREALLAQAVLSGRTSGYRHHPQLERFRGRPSPVGSIAQYLCGVFEESLARGYHFDSTKIECERDDEPISVTSGQLAYEKVHLVKKMTQRDATFAVRLEAVVHPCPHPLFRVVPGDIEEWERVPGKA